MAVIVLLQLVQGASTTSHHWGKKKDTKSQLCGGELTICKLLISRGLLTSSLLHWPSSSVQRFTLSVIKRNTYNKCTSFLHCFNKPNTFLKCVDASQQTQAQLTCSIQLHTPAVIPFALLWFYTHNRTSLVSSCVPSFTLPSIWTHRHTVIRDPAVAPVTPWKWNWQPAEDATSEELHRIRPSSRTLTGCSLWLKLRNFYWVTPTGSREIPFKADWDSVIQREVLIYYFLFSIPLLRHKIEILCEVHSHCCIWGWTKYYKHLTVCFHTTQQHHKQQPPKWLNSSEKPLQQKTNML